MASLGNIKFPWPDWTIVKRLGKGTYGTVYEIERDLFGNKERAALKIISIPNDEEELEDDVLSQFDEKTISDKYEYELREIVDEYRLMSEMKGHTNIVSCDDFATVKHESGIGWDIYIRMELLTPLNRILKTQNLNEAETVKLGIDICKALVVCQKKSIVHRDIKLQNILVSDFGDYKLGDFGVARNMDHTTMATQNKGSLPFMAPEVTKHEPYGASVDIYSLGITMYWLLNQRRMPFVPKDPKITDIENAQSRRISGEQIPPPSDGSEKLKKIVLKACSYRPENRYQSAQEMLDELQSCQQNGLVTVSENSNSVPDVNDTAAAVSEYRSAVMKVENSATLGNSWCESSATVGRVSQNNNTGYTGVAVQSQYASQNTQPENKVVEESLTLGNSWDENCKTKGRPTVKTEYVTDTSATLGISYKENRQSEPAATNYRSSTSGKSGSNNSPEKDVLNNHTSRNYDKSERIKKVIIVFIAWIILLVSIEFMVFGNYDSQLSSVVALFVIGPSLIIGPPIIALNIYHLEGFVENRSKRHKLFLSHIVYLVLGIVLVNCLEYLDETIIEYITIVYVSTMLPVIYLIIGEIVGFINHRNNKMT